MSIRSSRTLPPGIRVPVIRVEVEGIRERVVSSVMTMAHEWDDLIQSEIERALNEESVAALIRSTVQRCVEISVRDSLENHFKHGEGSEQLKALTEKALYPEHTLNPNHTGEENGST